MLSKIDDIFTKKICRKMQVFKDLLDLYPTWDTLSSFLKSEEGGSMSIRDSSSPYAIIRYTKGKTSFESSPSAVWLRSVVWNKNTHRPVCISPRKASKGMPSPGVPLRLETFIDGIMINVFATRSDDGSIDYHTVSRSQLDASGKFYSKRTFNELFMEALSKYGVKTLQDLFIDLPTEETPSICMSFVLQHPEHRIVEKIIHASLHLVEYTVIHSDGSFHLNTPFKASSAVDKMMLLPIEKEAVFTNEKDLEDYMLKESIVRGWTWQGLVLKDGEGNRWRIRNGSYTLLRMLRGNESDPKLRFLRLRTEGKVSSYLKHYSEDRDLFWEYESGLRTQTRAAYDAYTEVHKAHAKKLADIQKPHRTIVYLLHSHYLSTLKARGEHIRLGDTIQLVNSLPNWQQALFI